MIRNFFITAFRNFLRNKSFSLINIIGLAIGISASLVIFLIVKYDFSFEKFQPGRDRIYRIGGEYTFEGGVSHNSGSPIPMGNAVSKEVSGIEVTSFFQTRIGQRISVPFPGKENPVVYKKDNRVVYADKNYFKIIPYEWISGSAETALEQPYQVVLTESKAKLFFGNLQFTQIPGKEILLSDTLRATVTGIVKDITQHTDFTFNIFVSRSTYEIKALTPGDWSAWDNVSSETQVFVKLLPGITVASIESQLNAIYKKNSKQNAEARRRLSASEFSTRFLLQPLHEIHFSTEFDNFDQRLAHKPTLYGLSAIAAFLLLLGCINFINLTTAQSAHRAREIGIRKTLGSSRKQLMFQFLSETFLLTLMATLLSVIITPLLLHAFRDFIPKGLKFEIVQPQVMAFLLLLTLLITVLSGIYPAIVLSSYKPVAVLKNQPAYRSGSGRNVRIRKVLSVSQFVIAQVFIIVTFLVSKQIRFALDKDLGFKKDAIVFFEPNPARVSSINMSVLMQKIKAIPGLQAVSASMGPPSYKSAWTTMARLNESKNENYTNVSVKLGDTSFIGMYNIKLLAGHNLSPCDTINGLIINETSCMRSVLKMRKK
jgi:putative ABC transport system permease protein